MSRSSATRGSGRWSIGWRPRSRRRREAKLAVLHEGWRPRYEQGSGKEYELVNPVYIPAPDSGEAFWETVRGVLYSRFEAAKAALERDDVAQFLIEVVEAEKAAATPEEQAEIGQMRELLVGMGEALRDYRVRLQEKGVAVDPTWRGLGAAESNVDKFSNRLKKQGRAWREEGLRAMMTVQAKHYEGTLLSYLARAKTALNLPEWETVKVNTGKLVKEVTRASVGVIRGRFPALYAGTRGFGPILRELQRPQPVW